MSDSRFKGVYRALDFADDLQSEWETGIPPGLSTGFENLDTLYTVKKKQWTVVTGMPSAGKSTFVDNVFVNMAQDHGWKFFVISPENQPSHRHVENLIEILTGKKYANPETSLLPSECVTFEDLKIALAFIDTHFMFVCPDETDFHIDYILQLAKEVKEEFHFDGMLIDPYNEMEHKIPVGYREDQYISETLTKVRRFVRAEDIHLWFAAHPTKQQAVTTQIDNSGDLMKKKKYQRTSLYDIAGGAHWYNKADNGLVVYRNENDVTLVGVDKIRFKECGKKGDAGFVFERLNNRLQPIERRFV